MLDEQKQEVFEAKKLAESMQKLATLNNRYYHRVKIPMVINGRQITRTLFDIIADIDERRKKEIAEKKRAFDEKFSDMDSGNGYDNQQFECSKSP